MTATPAATPPAAPKADKPGKNLTRYDVLKVTGNSPIATYELQARVAAANDKAAIKEASQGVAGTYIAVPSRSFKAVTVTVEQTTTIRLT